MVGIVLIYTRRRFIFRVTMDRLDLKRRVFVYDSLVKTVESIIASQRLFRVRFNVVRHRAVPSRNTILRHPGTRRSITTPQNVEGAR